MLLYAIPLNNVTYIFSGVEMFVCNDETYGYVMVPMEKDDLLIYDLLQLKNLKLEVLGIYH